MEFLIWLIIFMGITWALAYAKQPLWLWSGAAAIFLVLATSNDLLHPLPLALLWVAALVVLVPLNLHAVRQQWITRPILEMFRAELPEISRTEQEALDSGTVWWEGELFRGLPDWTVLDRIPVPSLTEAEQAFMDGPVETLCARLDDWQITHHEHDLPAEIWAYLKQERFFGMIIPESYGGLGFSALGHSAVVMKIASRSLTAAVTVMVPNSLGPAMLLMHYGTDAQKDFYLPRLARGEEIPCFALTGPEAGSDAASLPDTGVVCRGPWQGTEVTGIRLNWNKRYITLGPVATVMGIAFRLKDPDHLLGDTDDYGITVALIDTRLSGVETGKRHYPLNIPFMNGPTRGRDVFVPLDAIIGGVEQAGNGWRMLMESLADGRSISLPALSTSAGKAASRYTGAYARVREQFNQPIGAFEGVEEKLAEIAGRTYLMDAARELTLCAIDQGHKSAVASAIVKYNLTENMRAVVDAAMDIQGGSGICLGPRNLLARAYQGVPIGITVEGANILTRTMIVFGQGAMRCHPFLVAEMQAAKLEDAHQRLQEFDRALFGHIGYLFANVARSVFLGITRGRLSSAPGSDVVRRYGQRINWLSAAYALVSDVALLTLGGRMKRLEKLSGRLADILSDLYLASAVIKRYRDQGELREDLPLMRWSCQMAICRIQQNFYGLFANLPNRYVAFALRWLIFPTGTPFTAPSDALGKEVAGLILAPGPARDRLTRGIFVHPAPGEQLTKVEEALELVTQGAPTVKKIQRAQRDGLLPGGRRTAELLGEAVARGVIDMGEAAVVGRADALRAEVIQVDEFEADLELAGRNPPVEKAAPKKRAAPKKKSAPKAAKRPAAAAKKAPEASDT